MKQQTPDKGTHYSPRETEQRSYFLPPGEGEVFKTFNNGNASTGMRGAQLVWMALYHFPDLREKAIRAAQNFDWTTVDTELLPQQMPAVVREFEKLLIEAVGNKAIEDWTKSLPEPERAKLLAEARKRR